MLIHEIPSLIFQNDALKATRMINTREKLRNHECYAPAIEYISESCLSLKVTKYAPSNYNLNNSI